MYVGLLDNRRERPLGLPTRLQKRGEVARVPHPWHLQLHRPYPRVPGALPVAVALSHPLGAPLVRCGTHMLFYLHLHERLGEHPNTLLEEIRVLIDHRLAQQLREPYPQFIGHRAFSFGRLVSSEGTTRWPSSSTAFASYTLARTLPAGGVASVAASKYNTLSFLLRRVAITDLTETKPVALSLYPWSVMESQLANLLPEMERGLTPLSDYLYETLREPLADYFARETDYMRSFGRF